jgi:hypothetical protein
MHKVQKRTQAQIDAYRGKMRRVMTQSDYRGLTSPRERVNFLANHHQVLPPDITYFTDVPETTVRRWIASPEKSSKRGRPSYLTPELEHQLFAVTVSEKFKSHTPMNNQEIIAEVKNYCN